MSVKLDDTNFYIWRQQVDGVIRSHKLSDFVFKPAIPDRYLSDADRVSDTVNPAFLVWEQRDSALFTWLLSTLSATVLPTVINCRYSWQIWEEIHEFFQTQSRAQSAQLRSELKTITKGSKTMAEYLRRIKTIVNALISIGEPVSFRDHLEVIFDGLPDEFSVLCTIISSQSLVHSISEVEAMIMTHEARLDRTKRRHLQDVTASALLTHASPSPSLAIAPPQITQPPAPLPEVSLPQANYVSGASSQQDSRSPQNYEP